MAKPNKEYDNSKRKLSMKEPDADGSFAKKVKSCASASDAKTHVIDPVLFEPFEYVNKIPGKDIRGKLISCFQKWIPVPKETMESIKEIVTLLHNASLLIDDIEDNSKLRRGIPVAHAIYGIANTINSANYVYFHALDKTHKLNNPKCVAVFIQELLNLHRGQGHDIYWREQCTCPTEEQYKQMVLDKTGGLFRLAVGLMQSFHDETEGDVDYVPLLNLLGYYFQIRDDYLNVSNDAYMQTKSYCEDLTEGKFSFPIIHAVRQFPNDTRLLNILKQRTENYEIKKYAVDYMQLCGSIEYTRTVLCGLRDELVAEIERLGGHAELTALMQYLDAELDRETGGGNSSSSSGKRDGGAAAPAVAAPAAAAAVTETVVGGGGKKAKTKPGQLDDSPDAPNPMMSTGAPVFLRQQTHSPSRKVSTL